MLIKADNGTGWRGILASEQMNEQRPLASATPFSPRLPAMDTTAGEDGDEMLVTRLRGRVITPAILLLLCAIPLAFFWKVVLLHQILLPFDILYTHDPLWRGLAPEGFTAGHNPLDSDALTEFYPWYALAADAVHRGTLPLWNPYAFAGTPFLAAMQPAVLYPINLLLEWALPPQDILGARAIIHLAVTLLGTWLFAWRLGLSRPAAIVAALAFGLGLPYVVWLEHPMSVAAAWLPWLLLCVDGMITSAHNKLRWCVAGAAVVALELLAGHGETTVHAALLGTAYAAARIAWSTRDRRLRQGLRSLPLLLAALLLGTGMAAAHLLPTLAQIPLSEAAADRSAASPDFQALSGGNPDSWRLLILALLPDIRGNPTWHIDLLQGIGYNEAALYIGAIPLVLAIIALACGPRRPALFWGVIALVALGAALRLPGLGALDALPVLRLAQNGRLRLEYAFAMAVLAGYGLDTIRRYGARRRLILLAWLAALGTAALAYAAWPALEHAASGRAQAQHVILLTLLPIVWLAAFAILLWLRRHGLLATSILPVLVVLLVGADLTVSGVDYHATAPRTQVMAVPPAIRAVQRDRSLYRIAGLDGALRPSLSSLYGLQDIRGYDPAYSARYERFFTTLFDMRPNMHLDLNGFGPSPQAARALSLLNVKYLFLDCYIRLNARVYHLVYRGSGCVYRNTAVMPRVFIVHQAEKASPEQATQLLAAGAIDPRRTALLDPTTAGRQIQKPEPGGAGREDSARITRYGLNRVDLVARTRTRGLLVLGDAYAPGWRATVDGRPAPIARADAILRAVALPPGTHSITFSYEPPFFAVGYAFSTGSGAMWLILSIVALWKRRPRARGTASVAS